MKQQVGCWLWKLDIQEKDFRVFSKSISEAMGKMHLSMKACEAKRVPKIEMGNNI